MWGARASWIPTVGWMLFSFLVEETSMPIPVSCSSCQAKINAPDHLAGKKAKCPRCSAVLQIPGSAPAPVQTPNPGTKPVAATTPRASTSATAPPKPRVKPAATTAPPVEAGSALPLLSFEELKIPPRYRRGIEKEVGEDRIVWMGRPNPQERIRQARLGPIFGIVLVLLAPAAGCLLLIEVPDENRWMLQLAAAGFIAMLLLMGLPLLFLPLLVRMFINYRPVYVLLERRAVVFHNIMGFSVKVFSYDRAELQDMKVHVRENGLGSIVMGTEAYEHIGRLQHRSDTRTSEDGSRKVVTHTMRRVGAHTSHIPVGFLDVDEVRAVEAMVRHTLKIPAPGSA